MAKVKFSALISEMRNKLNGSVFSKNRAGNYLRNKVTPVNPQSVAQMLKRGTFGTISQAWRGLTQAQRDAWIAATQNFPRTDIFGDIKYPSGQQLFMELNQNLAQVGTPIISVPPLPGEVPEYYISDAEGNPSVMTINLTDEKTPVGFRMVLEATAPLSPGKQFLKPFYRQITETSIETGSYNFQAQYQEKFGVPPVGEKIGVRMKLVNQTTGIAGTYSEATFIVGNP